MRACVARVRARVVRARAGRLATSSERSLAHAVCASRYTAEEERPVLEITLVSLFESEGAWFERDEDDADDDDRRRRERGGGSLRGKRALRRRRTRLRLRARASVTGRTTQHVGRTRVLAKGATQTTGATPRLSLPLSLSLSIASRREHVGAGGKRLLRAPRRDVEFPERARGTEGELARFCFLRASVNSPLTRISSRRPRSITIETRPSACSARWFAAT